MVQTINNTTEDTTYILSIQVSLNGLSFCVATGREEITVVEHQDFGMLCTPGQVLDKIKQLLDQHPALDRDFSTIEVLYHNDLYTLVPKAVFNEDLLQEYLQYNVQLLETDFVAFDELTTQDMVTVYVPYTNINNFFFEYFGSFTYKHTTTVLLENILRQQKHSDSITLFANMHKRFFDLIIVNKGKLQLANTYRHDCKEDFLYYLMFAAEQLGLNPEEFSLAFIGDITEESEYIALAYQYIRNVRFGNRNTTAEINTHQAVLAHQHFALLSHF